MTGTWSATVNSVSLLVTALGLGVGTVALVCTRAIRPALAVVLEMLTGAGLLRLAAAPTLTRALGAGGVLLVRQVATLGLRDGDPVAILRATSRRLATRAGSFRRSL